MNLKAEKVFIIAPEKKNEVADLVIFFEALKYQYENIEINISGERENIKGLALIDKNIRLYPYPEKLKSAPSAHKFAYNLKEVFNIDIVFDFEGTVKSAVLCLTLRPSLKVGKTQGINGVFYDHKMSPDKRGAQGFLDYLKVADSNFSEQGFLSLIEKKGTESVDPLFEDVVAPWRVLLIDEALDEEGELSQAYFDLVEADDQSHYIMLSQKKKEDLSIELSNLEFFEVTQDNFQKVLQHAEIVLTNLSWVRHLSAFRGVPTCIFSSKKDFYPTRFEKVGACHVAIEKHSNELEFVEFWSSGVGDKNLVNSNHVIDCINTYLESID